MSEPLLPLATATEIRGLGMILIRADLTRAGDAIAGAAGADYLCYVTPAEPRTHPLCHRRHPLAGLDVPG